MGLNYGLLHKRVTFMTKIIAMQILIAFVRIRQQYTLQHTHTHTHRAKNLQYIQKYFKLHACLKQMLRPFYSFLFRWN